MSITPINTSTIYHMAPLNLQAETGTTPGSQEVRPSEAKVKNFSAQGPAEGVENGADAEDKTSDGKKSRGVDGATGNKAPDGHELTEQELRMIQELSQRDREVRAHEQAHIAAGGRYVRSGATFKYETGPDGKRYATGGEVSIDTSDEKDPEATIKKMETVRKAALAPAQPSEQDRKVASQASRKIAKAEAELRQDRIYEREGKSDVIDQPGDVNRPESTGQKTDRAGSTTKLPEAAAPQQLNSATGMNIDIYA